MSKKPAEIGSSDVKNGPQNIVPAKALKRAFKLKEQDVLNRKLVEIQSLLFFPDGVDEEYQRIQLFRAVELYQSLKPADGAEGMLALQMVGTHNAALECLRRAALPNQTFEGRDMALKHAHKMMSLYTQQLAALNKHRGKGQQKVTVEHVNVAPGGQAFVGTVEQGKNELPKRTEPGVLDHKDALDVEDALNPASDESSKAKERKQ